MLQGEGSGEDPHGEADHQEALGASEGPAASGMDVWLQDEKVGDKRSASYPHLHQTVIDYQSCFCFQIIFRTNTANVGLIF